MKSRRKRRGVAIHAKSKKNKANEERTSISRSVAIRRGDPAALLVAYYKSRS
jgi:hypothetical protein